MLRARLFAALPDVAEESPPYRAHTLAYETIYVRVPCFSRLTYGGEEGVGTAGGRAHRTQAAHIYMSC